MTEPQPTCGAEMLIRCLEREGVEFIFGLSGGAAIPIFDALVDSSIRLVLVRHEQGATHMADGYARATQKPTLVQLHSSPGIGNAAGALYQAKRGHAPLVVIGGDAGIKYMAMDSQMAADLVAMMEPVTKWSTMVMDPSSLLRAVRRAIKIAATPPMGPVYVCLPQDILDAHAVESVRPTSIPSTRVVPDDETLRAIAGTLAAAERPFCFH